MTVWRICRKRFARTAFTGEGAALYGGRWNSPGVPMIYTAGSQSLAALEMLVHTADPNDLLNLDYVVIPVELEPEAIQDLPKLPRNWRTYPAPPSTTRQGDLWAKSKASLALRVPSVIIPAEFNFLLNPTHPDYPSLKTGKAHPFTFDSRLTKES